jgi:hypothetical protein
MVVFYKRIGELPAFKVTLISLWARIKSKKSEQQEKHYYIAKPTPGKIQVVPTKKYATQRDLSYIHQVWQSLA